MNTFDAIKERRSVKHYDTNHKITDNEINQLMSLAVLSSVGPNDFSSLDLIHSDNLSINSLSSFVNMVYLGIIL